jgi:AcrR family transcriptional regulator
MQEKKYSSITVQDIIDRADIGRSTFYAHFDTRDDLLKKNIENIFEHINNQVINEIETSEQETRILPLRELLEHIKENKRLIKGLMSVENEEVLQIVQSYWNDKVKRYLQNRPKGHSKVPPEIVTNHISGTMIEMLRWWVTTDNPYSPAQMDQYFHELIMPCVE